MKKSLFIIIGCLFIFALSAQVDIKDRDLKRRLDEYMLLNKELNFQKLMDYVHPSLFKIAPKKNILEVFEQSFNNDKVKIRFDSMIITSVEPAFKYREAIYRKVNYYTSMELSVKDSATRNNENYPEVLIRALEKGFPEHQVTYNKETDKFFISGIDIMFAIKDKPQTKWMFLGYKLNDDIMKTLFPKEVLAHYKLK